MNIIITGADGFVGTNLIHKLKSKRNNLLLVGKELSKMPKSTNIKSYSYLDLSQSQMRAVFEEFKPNSTIHLAAYSTASDSYDNLEILFQANILYLGKVLDALKNTKLDSFIYTGSFAEFFKGDGVFNPAYLYTATKTAGRSIVKYYSEAYNFKHLSICPYTIYGGLDTGKKIIDFLYDSLTSKTPVDVTAGNQVLDFIHVFDLVDLFVTLVENSKIIPNESLIHAGSGRGNTLKDLAKIMEDESGLKANINWGAREYRKRDVMHAIADIALQKRLLGWEPKISLLEGVKIYLKQKTKNNHES